MADMFSLGQGSFEPPPLTSPTESNRLNNIFEAHNNTFRPISVFSSSRDNTPESSPQQANEVRSTYHNSPSRINTEDLPLLSPITLDKIKIDSKDDGTVKYDKISCKSSDDDLSTRLKKSINYTPRHRQVSSIHDLKSFNKKPMSLNEFLYEQALGEGVCSDVTIVAFGKDYNLHKLILYRSPYFATLFSGLWNGNEEEEEDELIEGSGNEDNEHEETGNEDNEPEETGNEDNENQETEQREQHDDVRKEKENPNPIIPRQPKSNSTYSLQLHNDPHITQEVFELALGHLYGNGVSPKESKNLFGLFAIASFLDLPDLGDECLNQLVESINKDNVGEIASFATCFNYGRSSELVGEACKSFLCTEGNGLSEEVWQDIPSEILVKVAISDGFFIKTEWDRCQFLIKQYRSACSFRSELQEQSRKDKSVEDANSITTIKCDIDKHTEHVKNDESDTETQPESNIDYELIDEISERIKFIQEALNTGIHYAHMTPVQLESLESHRDEHLKPLIDRKVLRDGLWKQIMLQQTISKGHNSSALGFIDTFKMPFSLESDEIFYPVPSEENKIDSTQTCLGSKRRSELSWSRHPPFRFSVEFPDITDLEENKRTYSETFWYAGSFWNVYIQKVPRKKGYQLGVYLHRGKPDVPPDVADKVTLFSHAERVVHLEDEDDTSNEDLTTVAMENLSFKEYHSTLFTASTNSGNFLFDAPLNAQQTRPNPFAFGASSSGFGSRPAATTDDIKKIRPAVNMTPQYIDKRQKVSAYFKIYTTSRSGNPSLTCFSSSPDKFDISQSWGWKSSSLLSSANSRKGTSLKFMVVVGII